MELDASEVDTMRRQNLALGEQVARLTNEVLQLQTQLAAAKSHAAHQHAQTASLAASVASEATRRMKAVEAAENFAEGWRRLGADGAIVEGVAHDRGAFTFTVSNEETTDVYVIGVPPRTGDGSL